MSDSIRFRATAVAIAALSLVQLACGAGDGPTVQQKSPSGGLTVLIKAHGNGRDADGFTLSVEGSARAASYDSPIAFESLSSAQHTVRLGGVAPQCFAASDSIVRQVNAGVMDTVTFDVTCIGGFLYHDLTSATDAQIVYVGEDGRSTTVTSGPGRKLVSSWSRDGTRLVFSNDATGSSQLYTIRLDGTGLAALTSGPGMNYSGQWSPDGTQVAFTHYDNLGGAWIVITNADGTNRRVLTDSTHYDFEPVWSPDGTRLYFSCNRFDSMIELCSAAQDGSDVKPIRLAAITAIGPGANPQRLDMSPDGRSIAFAAMSAPSSSKESAWVAALDGSSATPLGTGSSISARWSPKSDRVVIETWNGQQNYGLAVVRPDGTAYLPISDFPNNDESPSWSPDGATIVFESAQSGGRQIWVMNADGSGRHQITTGAETKYAPMFNPKSAPVGTLSASTRSPSP